MKPTIGKPNFWSTTLQWLLVFLAAVAGLGAAFMLESFFEVSHGSGSLISGSLRQASLPFGFVLSGAWVAPPSARKTTALTLAVLWGIARYGVGCFGAYDNNLVSTLANLVGAASALWVVQAMVMAHSWRCKKNGKAI